MLLSKILSELGEQYQSSMSRALNGVEDVVWIDFPDHGNVGDSAIWLGQKKWANDHLIPTRAVVPYRSASSRMLNRLAQSDTAVVLRGGGFFGGLYPEQDQLRMKVLEIFDENRVIQCPQSIEFVDKDLQQQMIDTMKKHPRLTVMVRDKHSAKSLKEHLDVEIVPDAAHALGHLDPPTPQAAYTILARTDDESTRSISPDAEWSDTAIDWPRDPRIGRKIRQFRAEIAGKSGRTYPINFINYDKIAVQRLERGVRTISTGETVITDRLHAMILSLHCRRRVIAVDNSVKKLSRYAETWFGEVPETSLVFANDIEHAIKIAKKI